MQEHFYGSRRPCTRRRQSQSIPSFESKLENRGKSRFVETARPTVTIDRKTIEGVHLRCIECSIKRTPSYDP